MDMTKLTKNFISHSSHYWFIWSVDVWV